MAKCKAGDLMQVKFGIIQLKVTNDKGANLKHTEAMILEASRQGAKIIGLPEMFNCPYQQELFTDFAEEIEDGETIKFLSEMACRINGYIIGGSIPERDGADIYNTSLIFDPQGKIRARHRKVHLFDISIPGQIQFKESAVLSSGNDLTCFATEYGNFGVAICYDLRFPELFRLMVERGVIVVVVPAAFNMTTGPAHWEILFKSRAIDNQVFIIGISPARDQEAGYIAYGHSIVVDPWGEIIWKAGTDEEIGVVSLELDKVAEVRQKLPLLAHRRLDLYQVKKAKKASISPEAERQRP